VAERIATEPGGLRGLFRKEQKSALHPLTGLAILGLDWLFFGGELLTGFVMEPLLVPLGALSGFIATFAIERRYAGRSFARSFFAAMFAALAVGVPWPISGTLIGVAVLILAGLRGR
jgi:hypothetical protein